MGKLLDRYLEEEKKKQQGKTPATSSSSVSNRNEEKEGLTAESFVRARSSSRSEKKPEEKKTTQKQTEPTLKVEPKKDTSGINKSVSNKVGSTSVGQIRKPTAYQQWAANNPAMAAAQEARSAAAKKAREASKKPTQKSAVADKAIENYVATSNARIDQDIAVLEKKRSDAHSKMLQANTEVSGWMRSGATVQAEAARQRYDAYKKEYDDIGVQIVGLERQKGQNEKALKVSAYQGVMALPDFDEVSKQGAAIANPDINSVYAGEKTRHASGIGAQYLQDSKNFDDVQNKATFVRDGWDNLPTYLQDWIKASSFDIYRYMEPDEVNTYSYLLAKDGKDAAEEYLNFILETLNWRKGTERGEKLMSIKSDLFRPVVTTLYGLGAVGPDQWISGTTQLFSSERLPTSATQFAGQYIRENSGPVEGFFFDAATVTGNMLPSILIGKGTGLIGGALGLGAKATGIASTVAGAAAVGAGASGNAYNQALSEGYTKEEARKYAVLVGASEAGLSAVLSGRLVGGNIPKALATRVQVIDNALARVAATWAISTGGEVTEEVLQEYLEPAFRSLIFDVDYDAPNFEEIAYVALLTAVSAGSTSAVDVVSSDVADTKRGKEVRATEGGYEDLVGNSLELDPTTESYKTASRFEARGGNVSDAAVGGLQRTYAIDSVKYNKDKLIEVTERAKAYGEDTKAARVAKRIEDAVSKGKEVADEDIAELLVENDNESRNEVIDKIRTDENAVRSLTDAGKKAGGKTARIAERIATKLENGEEITREETQSLMEGNQRAYTKVARSEYENIIKRVAGYGEHGMKTLSKMRKTIDVETTDLAIEFDTPYQAGLVNQNPDKLNLDTDLKVRAYEAGLLDYNAQVRADRKHRASVVYTSETSNVDWTHAPSDISTNQKRGLEFVSRVFGVKVAFSKDETRNNAYYDTKTGEVLFDEGFGIPPSMLEKFGNESYIEKVEKLASQRGHSLTFYVAHEIATHRAIDLAPTEMRAFVHAMYAYKQSKETGKNLARDKQDFYLSQNASLSTEVAFEEVVADSILDLYNGDEQAFMDAIERIVNGTDENAKQGAREYFGWLSKLIERVKAWAKNLTGKAKVSAEKDISSLEDLRNMFEKAIAKSIDTVEQARKSGKAVSVAPKVTSESNIKESIKGTLNAAGLDAVKDENGRVIVSIGGKQVKSVTAEHIRDNSAMGGLIKQGFYNGFITEQEAETQYEMFADIVNMIINTEDPELVWAWTGSSLFSAVKSNADGQYGTTIDFTTICRKTQDMITAMSRSMMKLKRGLTKAEITELQKELLAEGSSVPCPVCYVFSRWAGVGSILDNMSKWQTKYENFSDEQVQERITLLEEKFKSENRVKGKELVATLRDLDEEYDQLNFEQESLADEKKRLQPKKRAAVRENDAHALSEINNRITEIDKRTKQIKDRLKYIKGSVAPELAWLTQVRAAPDYKQHGRVPSNVLFNLNDAATFAEKYPLAWKYRSTRGPSAGKAILPYSDMQLGDIILGVGNTSADGNKLFADANGEFTAEQKAAVDKAIARTKAQNLIGGQRFQSTSDFRYDYALDYLMAFLECQAIGAKMQTYTKIIEFGDMVAAVGGDFNLSVMPRNKGYITLPNGTNQLVFSSVTGISYEAAVRSSQMHDNGQLILVGINDAHILAALEDSEETRGANIGFVIPYHASGASIDEFIRVLVSNLGETYMAKNYMDYSDVQSDAENGKATAAQKRRNDLRTKLLKGKDGAKNWEPTAEDLKFIRGESVDISDRSFEELRAIERKALRSDKAAIAEYESWTRGALWSLYEKLWSNESSEYHGVRLNSAQAKSVMPHEYWNKTVGRDKAYINGFLFRSYCYNLGLSPRFTGVGAKGAKHGDFSDSKGYWKLLIDRPMYNNDGTYRDQQRVNVTKLQKEMLTPSYAKKNWGDYKVQEPSAERAGRAADRFVAQKNTTTESVGVKRSLKGGDVSNAPTFYSEMERVTESIKQEKLGAASVVPMLRGKGVKAEEIKWSGIEAFLEGKRSVTKQELLEFMRGNRLEVEEETRTSKSTNIEVKPTSKNTLDVYVDGKRITTYTKNKNGEWEPSDPQYYSHSTKQQIYKDFEDEYGNNTKWSKYKLDGGKNYREVVFNLPKSTHSNGAMQGHWGTNAQGVLAHARVQDFRVDGGKMLFVEEIQSDWHNEGNKQGYDELGKKTTTDIRNDSGDAFREFIESDVMQEVERRLGRSDYSGNVSQLISDVFDGNKAAYSDLSYYTGLTGEERAFISKAIADESKRQSELLTAPKKTGVVDAPFKNTYHEFVMKRLIREAAENGYDSIGWTTADIQSERWSDEFSEGYRIEYDQDIPKFLKKYGKQWGAEVSKTNLKGQEIWKMEITDAMRESVLKKGQPMYSLKGEDEFRAEVNRIREAGKKAGKSEAEIRQDVMEVVNPQYAELLKEFGAYGKGEKASREIEVPKKSDVDRPVSQSMRNILEAEVTPDTLLPNLQELITTGYFSYDAYTDKAAIDGAERTIKRKTFSIALADWMNNVDKGIVNKSNTALGWALYNQAANSGDAETAIEILIRMVGHQRNAAQALQASRILKKLSPDAQLYSAVKEAQKLEDDLNEKSKRKPATDEEAEEAAVEVADAKEESVKQAKDAHRSVRAKRNGNRVRVRTKEGRNQIGEPFVFEYAQKVGEDLAKRLEKKHNQSAKQKTFLQNIVSELNKFANEKFKKVDGGKKHTAIDTLRDYIQNQSFYSEAWEAAQIELRQKYANDPIFEEFINSGIGVDANSNPQNALFMRALVSAAAETGETKAVLRRQDALGFTGMADAIADNLIEQTGAEGEMADTIRDASHAYVMDVVAETDSDKLVDGAIRSAMEDIGLKLSEIVLEGKGESAQHAITDLLVRKYGFSNTEATHTAEVVAERFGQMTRKFAENRLKSMFKERNVSQKTIQEKLTQLGRLGAFDIGSEYNQRAAERIFKTGFPIMVNETLASEFLKAKTQEERDKIMIDIYKDIGSQLPSTFMDKFRAWRYLAMLGNARTHVRNILGNAFFAPVVATKTMTASAIESTVNFIAKKSGRTFARTKGRVNKALLKAAWNDFANVSDIISTDGKYNETANRNKYIEEGRTIFKGKLGAPLEKARRLNSELMEREDMWFSKPHYAFALAQYCSANGITAEQLQKGKALGNAREYAIKEAQKATFRDTNDFSEYISKIGRQKDSSITGKIVGGVMEGVLPFRKTPANILVRGVEYSPIGLAKSLAVDFWRVRRGDITGSEWIDNISAGLTGTGLFALGMFLAAQGVIRGHGAGDDDERKFEELQGHQSYSLELPDGTSITLDWLAPEALPFFMGVNYSEMKRANKETVTMADLMSTAMRITEPMLEMSCLQGLNDAIDTFGYAQEGDLDPLPKLVATGYANLYGQVVPTLFGQLDRSLKDKRMTTYTEKSKWFTSDTQYTLGKTSAKIPGWDYQQIPYIDAWGREERTGNPIANAANNFLNPAYMSKVETGSVEKEISRLYDATGEAFVFPKRADKSFNVDGERKHLTANDYVKYAKEKGKVSYELVSELINSDGYKNLDDAEKAEAISQVYEYANAVAKSKVDSQYQPSGWVDNAIEANSAFDMDETNYILYNIAKQSIKWDDGKEGISVAENARSILSVPGLSDAEMAYLFDGKVNEGNAYDAYSAGIDMDDYLTYKIAMESLTWQKGKNGAKKEAVTRLLNSLKLDRKTWNYLYHKENGYK